jgi:hypothetical protein
MATKEQNSNPKNAGRKKIERLLPEDEFDWAEFEKLCMIQCTRDELIAWFCVSPMTMDRRVQERYGRNFGDVWAEKRRGGHISLRRSQWQKALGGSTAMLIWLGKNILGQSDNPINTNGDGDVIFQSRIGPTGNVIQEVIKVGDAARQFMSQSEVAGILVEELKKKHLDENKNDDSGNKKKRIRKPRE